MNDRRKLIVALGAGALTAPFGSFAQPQGKVWRIGVLGAGSPAGWAPMVEALRAGLRELGYIEGSNINIDYRWADGQYDRLPELVADLIRLKVDVIVTHATAGIGAAKRATTTMPIIMASIGDPVASGLLTNLSRPGGNITGLSVIAPELASKRLELIRELLPRATLVGELVDPANTYWQRVRQDYEQAFRSLRMQPLFVEVANPGEIEKAIAQIASRRADALIVRGDPTFTSNREQIARLAVQHALPTIAEDRTSAEAGILMSYGPDNAAAGRIVAGYIDRILRGAKPGDLPIAQPTKFEFVINLKTAKALGMTIPQPLLLRADQVIS